MSDDCSPNTVGGVVPPRSLPTAERPPREILLQIIDELTQDRPDRDFRLYEVMERLKVGDSTIRASHARFDVTSSLCADAPHCRHRDVDRVGPGWYRLRDGGP